MTNRLINEKSPYLLQHAHNPVDWWPWCEAAFDKAKAEDKPVFLSVGYSTCHWCHVMERESFEDQGVADILNRGFVSIKVDREERPDIDNVYMGVTQMFTGGGWPMTVFMDCDKKPFFAGTYFPKQDTGYGIGFATLLEKIEKMWKADREKLTDATNEIMHGLSEQYRRGDVDYDLAIQNGFASLSRRFDPEYGGFGSAPKFPAPHTLMMLMRYYHMYKDAEALEMVEKTLTSMYRGGIRDHLGFGFCRYSTDNMWLAPHFEKMLYDNALLATAYGEAYQITKKPFYRKAVEEIIEYITRDMTSPEGAFYSAEDADSEGTEGKFYTFTKRETVNLLGHQDGERFCREYDITDTGNFEGRNIPNLIENADFAEVLRDNFYAGCLRRLFEYRENRIHPQKDDKILSAWNGLMICALSYAGRIFENAEYINKAATAADFILKNMVGEDGKLFTRYRDGEARFYGVADDYAYVVMGLIELYQASFNVKYLTDAYRLNQILVEDFYEDGALYRTGRGGETLISRPRELYDGAMPSYNSVSIGNFAKLAHLYDSPELLQMAGEIIRFFGVDIASSPQHFCSALCGMMLLNGAHRQIVLTGENTELIRIINGEYQPFVTFCLVNDELSRAVSFYKNYNDKTAAYICEGSRCEAPIFDAETLRKRLRTTNITS